MLIKAGRRSPRSRALDNLSRWRGLDAKSRMLRHERWLAFDAEGKPAEPSLRSALVETFEHFERTRPPPSAASLRSTVVLDDGTGQPWTIRIDRGNFTLTPG